ncbi:hypothetical protein HanIR_Chr05g0240981 [Helianthus annuus]|nr:hypothetical protein HanIR_Chr05g0240981 [Helianthus annuus]
MRSINRSTFHNNEGAHNKYQLPETLCKIYLASDLAVLKKDPPPEDIENLVNKCITYVT